MITVWTKDRGHETSIAYCQERVKQGEGRDKWHSPEEVEDGRWKMESVFRPLAVQFTVTLGSSCMDPVHWTTARDIYRLWEVHSCHFMSQG